MRHDHGICLEELGKTTKNFAKVADLAAKKLKTGTPVHKVSVITMSRAQTSVDRSCGIIPPVLSITYSRL